MLERNMEDMRRNMDGLKDRLEKIEDKIRELKGLSEHAKKGSGNFNNFCHRVSSCLD